MCSKGTAVSSRRLLRSPFWSVSKLGSEPWALSPSAHNAPGIGGTVVKPCPQVLKKPAGSGRGRTARMLTFLWLWVLRNAFLGSVVFLPVTFALFLLGLSGAGPGTAVMQLDRGLEIVQQLALEPASPREGSGAARGEKGHRRDCAPMRLPKTTHPGAFQRSQSPRAHRRKSSQAEGWSQASLCSWSDSGPWGL